MNLKLIAVSPTGEVDQFAFVERADSRTSGLEHIRTLIYPKSEGGLMLTSLMEMAGLGLSDTAKLLGIKPSAVSGLEQGRFTLSREDWIEVFSILIKAKQF